jgi:hypothetical protein
MHALERSASSLELPRPQQDNPLERRGPSLAPCPRAQLGVRLRQDARASEQLFPGRTAARRRGQGCGRGGARLGSRVDPGGEPQRGGGVARRRPGIGGDQVNSRQLVMYVGAQRTRRAGLAERASV